MELDKRRVGEWIRVKFWDHCIEEARPRHKKQPILCEVAGFLVSSSAQHIIVSSWLCHHPSPKSKELNVEEFVIVRSTITEWGFANVDRWCSPG